MAVTESNCRILDIFDNLRYRIGRRVLTSHFKAACSETEVSEQIYYTCSKAEISGQVYRSRRNYYGTRIICRRFDCRTASAR